MKPFKNKGWSFWDRLEMANPGQSAGGSHVFAPHMNTDPPPLDETEGDDEDADADGVAPSTTGPSNMDLDVAASMESSAPFTPTDTSSPGTSAIASGTSTLLSSAASLSSQHSSSSRARGKKRVSNADTDAEAMPPPPPKRQASSSSRLSSSPESTSSSSGVKGRSTSVNIMMTKMDNTMAHMVDMFKDNLTSDRGKAITQIMSEVKSEERRDGWEIEEVQRMVDVFTSHLNLAESYLAQYSPFREHWVRSKLDAIQEQVLRGVSVADAIKTLG